MYDDPAMIRDQEVKIRLNQDESEIISAVVKLTREQRAVIARQLLIQSAVDFLKSQPNENDTSGNASA